MATIHIIGLHGECLRTFMGSESAFADQLQFGEIGVTVPRPSSEHYWTDSGWVQRETRPSSHHIFDWPTHAWIDPRDLEDHKDAKWDEMKTAREVAFDAPLETPHGTFDSDARGRSNITDAVLMAQALTNMGSPVAIDFTLADNSVVTLNAEQMIEVGLYLGAKVQAAYSRARELREAIYAATTISEVESIAW